MSRGAWLPMNSPLGHKSSDMTEQLTHKTMGFFVVVVLFHHWSILWEFLHNQSYYLRTEVKVAQLYPTLCNPMDYYSPWNSPGQSTSMGSVSLLQGIFPTQGLNRDLPHCRRILYPLSHKGKLYFFLSNLCAFYFLFLHYCNS